MWSRRRFISIGVVAGLGAVGGCSKSGRSANTSKAVPTSTSGPASPANVSARYVAAPMSLSLAGTEGATWGYDGLLRAES
jgi:hypothetical protein